MNQEISTQDLELQQVGPDSPQSLSQVPQSANNPGKSTLFLNIKRCALLLIVILASSILIVEINGDNNVVPLQPLKPLKPDEVKLGDFEFLVFCPQSYAQKTLQKYRQWQQSKQQDELRRRLLFQGYESYMSISAFAEDVKNYDASKTYVVVITSLKTEKTQIQSLFYCGLARKFHAEDCSKAIYACTSPGPMFDLKTNDYADVIWVNLLDPKVVPDKSECINNTNSPHCSLMSKINQTQTYQDPAGSSMESKAKTHSQHIKISPNNWPVSTHVHGAEVRPTFDGNPLSWIDNDGQRGVGAFSLLDKCYYESFDNSTVQDTNYMPPDYNLLSKHYKDLNKVSKVNRYPNKQNPGNLWYHDHAMRLTNYNVKNGLAGLYILRNQNVEDQIDVPKENQKLIMMTMKGWQQSLLSGIVADTVYRFRFLNNNFGGGPGTTYTISFSYDKQCNDKFLDDRIDFSIIGADSSLFDKSIDKQKSFFIAQAQRMEILIKFKSGSQAFSICTGKLPPPKVEKELTPQQIQIVKSIFKLGSDLPTKDDSIYNIPIQEKPSSYTPKGRSDINNVTLPGAAFVDLSTKLEKQIAVKRMRPLIRARAFTINGRNDYHKGKSQNPVIGSTEDWYIINTMGSGHPIHVHLINFQVVKQYRLRAIFVGNSTKNKTCALYELQFLVEALSFDLHENQTLLDFKDTVIKGKKINYAYLCDNKESYLYSNPQFDQNLQQVNVQDQKDQNRVSGIDVRLKATAIDQANFKGLTLIPQEQLKKDMLKFVTDNGSESPKPYYARWKDTAYAQAFQVLVFRMRWAKSAYKENSNDKYFHVPADQLRQFPGYVYHCHILGHEDNEMMRSIMLQLPQGYQLNTSIPCNKNNNIYSKKPFPWSEKYLCINNKCNPTPKP